MASELSGATLGINASSFSGTKCGPPKTGQFFLGIDLALTPGNRFAELLTALVEEMHDQPGVRVPGDGRRAAQG